MKRWVLRFAKNDLPLFRAVQDGRKSIETRAATPRYMKVQAGDILVMLCAGERCEKQVAQVRHFASPADLFEAIDYRQVMPLAESRDEAVAAYAAFTDYLEKIAVHGLVTFDLENP